MTDKILSILLVLFKIAPLILFIAGIIVFNKKTKKNTEDYVKCDFQFRVPTADEMDAAKTLMAQKKATLKTINLILIPIVLFFAMVAYNVVRRNTSGSLLTVKTISFILLTTAPILCLIAADMFIVGRINDLKEGRFLVAKASIIERAMVNGPKGNKEYRLKIQDSNGITDDFAVNRNVYTDAMLSKECLVVRYNNEDDSDNNIRHRDVIPL